MTNFKRNHHPDWDIRNGDYTPDPHSTNTYIKNIKRNYTVKRAMGLIIYAVILAVLVYMLLN
jgi:hypothetical protein